MTNHSCRHLKTGFIKSEACHVLKIHDASIHSHETLESRLAPSKYTCRRDLPLMPIQSLNERTTARVASISARRSCQDCIRSCTNATATNSDLKSLQFDVSLHMFESEYILKASGLPLAGKHVSIQAAKSISSSCQHQLQKKCSIAVSTSNSKFLRTGRNPWFCTSSSNIDRPLPVARQLS